MVPMPLRRQLMEVAHESVMGGHMGVKKTTDKIQKHSTGQVFKETFPDAANPVIFARRL